MPAEILRALGFNTASTIEKRLKGVKPLGQIDENSGMSSGNIFTADYLSDEAILKLSQRREEVRQIGDPTSHFEPWSPHIIINEYKSLQFLNSTPQRTETTYPRPLFYQLDGDVELSGQTRMNGTRLDTVLPYEVQYESNIAFSIGKAIGELQTRDVPSHVKYGSLADGVKFDTWKDFYLHTIKAGVSRYKSVELFKQMQKLAHFSELAGTYAEWEGYLEEIVEVYESDSVSRLLDTDGRKTFVHGDFWQGNFFVDERNIGIYDFDRAMIGGQSYDLALYLVSGVDDVDPVPFNPEYFNEVRQGFESVVPLNKDFDKLVDVYGLWWRLETLPFDAMKGYDRSYKAVEGIAKHKSNITKAVNG